jgi:Fur family zinc uptake transcriptional regulator
MTQNTQLTRNQSLVLARLEEAQSPLSAYALLDQLRGDGIRAPLQVYRALDALVRSGRVHRLESLNSFVACNGHHHHHGMTGFAICDACGAVEEFTDAIVTAQLQGWGAASGFRPSSAVIELRGLCALCQIKTA